MNIAIAFSAPLVAPIGACIIWVWAGAVSASLTSWANSLTSCISIFSVTLVACNTILYEIVCFCLVFAGCNMMLVFCRRHSRHSRTRITLGKAGQRLRSNGVSMSMMHHVINNCMTHRRGRSLRGREPAPPRLKRVGSRMGAVRGDSSTVAFLCKARARL